MPYELALKCSALPLGVITVSGRQVLSIACGRSPSPETLADLKFASDKEVRVESVPGEIIEKAIFFAYHRDDEKLKSAAARIQSAENSDEARGKVTTRNSLPAFAAPSGESAQFLQALIEYAISLGASDLHIVPRLDGTRVMLRVDGELLSKDDSVCNLRHHEQIIQRLKVLCALDTSQHKLPQDGAFAVPLKTCAQHVRVSLMPTVHGEKAVLRFMGCEGQIGLQSLGLEANIINPIQDFLDRGEGLLLCAGPTGSGKSTTMYAIMAELARRNLSLVSAEDPVELMVEGVAQTSINEKVGLDYPTCLRSLLRQDPDAILIGEIRDAQSARIAFQAALTGHLVISTVHARNVFDVLLRVRDLGVDALSVAQALQLVLCQRLLPKLCERCRVIDLQASNELGFAAYKRVGCAKCDYSGYSGRSLATEMLHMKDEVATAIGQGRVGRDDLLKLLDSASFVPLQDSVSVLLRAGVIERGDGLT